MKKLHTSIIAAGLLFSGIADPVVAQTTNRLGSRFDSYGVEQPPAPYFGKEPPGTLEIQVDFSVIDAVCAGTAWHYFEERACARRGAFQAMILAFGSEMPKAEAAKIEAAARKNPDVFVIVIPKQSWPGMQAERQNSLRTHEWGHACLNHNNKTARGWFPAPDALPWCKTLNPKAQ